MSIGGFNPLGAVAGTAIGVGVGGAVSPVIAPLVQDLVNEAWGRHPSRPLAASLVAQLVAEGLLPGTDGAGEASRSGYDGARFASMVEAAREGPQIGNALEGIRRGLLDATSFDRALRQAGMRPEWFPFLRALSARLLSSDELANMVVRGVLTHAEAQHRASLLGLDANSFGFLVQVTGNPPGNMEALDLWNRGEIAEADVDRALRQSNLKPEWFANFKALRYFIPSVADLVRFAVREVFTPDIRRQYGLDDEFPADFEREGAKRGLSPEWARAYWAAHWELPSIEQAFRMLHRRLIGFPDLNTLLRTKDVMPYWRERLTQIAYLVPGRVDLRRMFRAGVISEAQVYDGYLDLGYAPDTARTLTDFAISEKQDAATRGSLLPMYRRRVVAAAHREYTSRQITEAEARSALGQIGIPAATIADLFPLWDLERGLKRRELTEADIRAAFKKDQYTEAEALAELGERGMSSADATKYLRSVK
jgi:hypothetical protein